MIKTIDELVNCSQVVSESVDSKIKEIIDNSGLRIKPANVKYGYRELLGYIRKIFLGDQYHTRKYLKEDSVVIDAGANTGTFSILASLIVQKGKVYAFEPTIDTFNVLSENTNPYINIVAVNSALGDRCEETIIMTSNEDSAVNYLKDSEITKGSYEYNLTTSDRVPMTTIDQFVLENNLKKVDFIKMDTEGYEKQVIMGARETIKRFKPVLALSAYHLGGDKKDIPDLVRSIEPKYNCKLSHEYEEIFHCWI